MTNLPIGNSSNNTLLTRKNSTDSFEKMTGTEDNETGTITERYIDQGALYVAALTGKIRAAMSNKMVSEYVVKYLEGIVWGAPLLTMGVAPKTFTIFFLFGASTGVLSLKTMEKIFEDANVILNGGDGNKNTNFKVSLIFAVVIVGQLVPIVPSLPKVYAAIGGFILGIKISQCISKNAAKFIAQKIDGFVMSIIKMNPKTSTGVDQTSHHSDGPSSDKFEDLP